MEFRLLGNVEADHAGRPLNIGPARRQCVLVALLVDANRSVSVDQLIDRIWGDHPPQRAREVLYSYLSRLRQVIASADDARIVRRAAGYVLTVDPMMIDAHRFQDLVKRARVEPDDAVAVALFDEALVLWRGPAFGNLDTPWLNGVRDDLDRQRRAAELDRNDAGLRCGRHTDLLTGLVGATRAHPLDERLAGQLMLAFYRCGRQADALDYYHGLRLRLAEELGADPSPPLRHLYHQILTADAALDLTAPRARPAVAVPRQVPASTWSFAGRRVELDQLDRILEFGGIAAISGTAGVGKTALAIHWARQHAGRFPDGQLYLDLRGFDPAGQVVEVAEALRRFLDALGVAAQRVPADLGAQIDLYRSLVAGRQMLIILDNARDAAHVRPLLPGAGTCLVLVTSRRQLTGLIAVDGAHPVGLRLLSDDEAKELLARRLGDRVACEAGAVDDIISYCARLPLALAIVAARAAGQRRFPLAAFARELREARDRLDALAGDDPAADVRAVFSWSYQALTPAAARLFRLLGLHSGPDISAPAAASLAGLPLASLRPLLAELARTHLIDETTPSRYACHDLLRVYADELAHAIDTEDDRHAAMHRLLDHFLRTAHAADRLLDPSHDQVTLRPPVAGTAPEHLADAEQALAWFTRERQVLLAVVELASSAGFDMYTWQITFSLTAFLDRLGHHHDEATTYRMALAAARRQGNWTVAAQVHRGLARAYARLARYRDATVHLGQALGLSRELGDAVGQASTHLVLAWVLDRQGQHGDALDHSRQAAELYRTIDHRAGLANALNAIGWYHAQLGQYGPALAACQRALELHETLDDRQGQAETWDSIGYVNHRLGHHRHAAKSYERAVGLHRGLGHRSGEAYVLVHLGDTRHAAGQADAARDAWQSALDIYTELNRPDADAVAAKLRKLDR